MSIVPKRGEVIDATVVSVIIRDFIHLTERLSSTSLTSLMSDYYSKVGLQVEQQQGVLTSISNFSMVVTFSDVKGVDAHARRALRCALAIAMIAYQTRFWIRQAFPKQGLDKFGVGIGIHGGELVFAEFGVAPHVQQVASGHAVSVASLLANKSKELDWNIVCSEQSLDAAGAGVKTRRHSVIGAEWLNNPVRVAEVVVVQGVEEEVAKVDLNALDTTLVLDRGESYERYEKVDTEQYATLVEANLVSLPLIPGYRCLRSLGRGGMSRVYLVERLDDGGQFALKFADGSVSQDSEVLYRFVEEYGLLEQLRHPNVIRIVDQGVTDDALFIVMEYLPGGTLKQHIGSNGMELQQALDVLRGVALALVEAHKLGIIHRDIKPENIMLRGDGAAVLCDFGVAQQMRTAAQQGKKEFVFGTPYYMSPEQALGEMEDARTDIYSMGAVFFYMLTGEKPYQGDTLEEIVQQHLLSPVPSLPPCYAHLQPLLEGMMAKDKEQRYSAAALLQYLDELEAGRKSH
ncbi:MAG: protein kinase [Sideroxydans sp.]|nr:protein kinase [Sideroxydans sp.]